jgi:hypothetical protein
MAENSEINQIKGKTDNFDLSKEEAKKIPLLPRSAWNNQLTHLKVLLKAKQALDQRQYQFEKEDN